MSVDEPSVGDDSTISPDDKEQADAEQATETENDQAGAGTNQRRPESNDVRTQSYSPRELSCTAIASLRSEQRTDLRTRDSHFSRYQVYDELDAAEGQHHE